MLYLTSIFSAEKKMTTKSFFFLFWKCEENEKQKMVEKV